MQIEAISKTKTTFAALLLFVGMSEAIGQAATPQDTELEKAFQQLEKLIVRDQLGRVGACVFEGKEGKTESEVRALHHSCLSKENARKDAIKKEFGDELSIATHTALVKPVGSRQDEYESVELKNVSESRALTFVTLRVRDPDYGAFVHPEGVPRGGLFEGVWEDRWKAHRQRDFHYKLHLQPGKSIKLRFKAKPDKSGDYSFEVTNVRGIDPKSLKSVNGVSESVDPLPTNPIEE